MKSPTPELLELMKQAAELRVLGASWTAIAESLDQERSTCSNWPWLYPEAWRRMLHLARRERVSELQAESHLVLQKLLRHGEEKSQLAAAAQLLKSKPRGAAKKVAETTSDAELAAFISQIKEFSDEELDEALREFDEQDGVDPGKETSNGSPESQ